LSDDIELGQFESILGSGESTIRADIGVADLPAPGTSVELFLLTARAGELDEPHLGCDLLSAAGADDHILSPVGV
jgi:hypothetical protein